MINDILFPPGKFMKKSKLCLYIEGEVKCKNGSHWFEPGRYWFGECYDIFCKNCYLQRIEKELEQKPVIIW